MLPWTLRALLNFLIRRKYFSYIIMISLCQKCLTTTIPSYEVVYSPVKLAFHERALQYSHLLGWWFEVLCIIILSRLPMNKLFKSSHLIGSRKLVELWKVRLIQTNLLKLLVRDGLTYNLDQSMHNWYILFVIFWI